VKLLFPDPCWNEHIISGSAFLYFNDEPILFPLHASVSTFITGIDPFEFQRLVEERQPRWGPAFLEFMARWQVFRSRLESAGKLLEPLRGKCFKTAWIIYPRGANAWTAAEELLSASRLSYTEIASSIDPFCAADELFSHIFFEKYLELYHPGRESDHFVALGQRAATQDRPPKVAIDWSALYGCCEHLFGSADLRRLLTVAYMFRMPMVSRASSVLLSNPGLVAFLESLQVESSIGANSKEPKDMLDVVAWEFFRQLVSPVVDPLDAERVRRLETVLNTRAGEIARMKTRCLQLAQELGQESDIRVLEGRIREYVRVNVQKDVQDVLGLDNENLRKLMEAVFADEKTWLGISGILFSLLHGGGGSILSVGSAICALSSLGSKAVKVAGTQRETLRSNDYALLYRLK
jgi:hypothetical protein